MSWLGKLQEAKAEIAAHSVDPWQVRLEQLHGSIGYDGINAMSSQAILDILEIDSAG